MPTIHAMALQHERGGEPAESDDASGLAGKSMLGRRAVVTGGSSGIGAAIASALAHHGARVHIADVQSPACDIGDSALEFRALDVSSSDGLFQLANSLQQQGEMPDIIIACAGRGCHERLDEGDPDRWAEVIDINVIGVMRTLRALLPLLNQRERDSENKEHTPRGGDVVLIASVAAEHPYEYGGAYAASKAAVLSIAETLRKEAPPSMRITVVLPGVTDTPFFESMSAGFGVDDIGWGALQPEDVADAVLWALMRPRHVAINRIDIRPTRQRL